MAPDYGLSIWYGNVDEKTKGDRKAGTIRCLHVLQFVKPINIVNNST
jgi:hypothetical protein